MTTIRSVAGALVAVLLAGACGSGGADSAAAVPTETSTTAAPPVTTAPATTTDPALLDGESDAGDDTARTEAPTTTSAPTSTTIAEPECEAPCPISDEERAAIERTIAAYNSGDWEAFLATVVESEPDWETPIGPQTADLVRFDFGWSAALNEVWTLGDCVRTSLSNACDVSIADDVHRGLGPIGLPPSECRIFVEFVDGLVDIRRYDLYPCHERYDSAFHGFSRWLEENHPEVETVQGAHYRGWRQTDVTAPARAAEYLPGYVAFRREFAGLEPWDPGDLTHEYPDDGG